MFFEGVVVGVEEKQTVKFFEVSFNVVEEKKYSVPIPEELKGFKIPKNIRRYITVALPNIHQVLNSRGIPQSDFEWIVGEFVIYMLGTSKKGTPRYAIYNPEKYPDIPYFKWFLNQVQFFILQDLKRKKESAKNKTLSIVRNDEYEEDCLNKNEVSENQIGTKNYDVFDVVYTKQIAEYLKTYELRNKKEEYFQGTLIKRYFENHAYDLFMAKLNGEQNKDFANKIGVSSSTVTQWIKMLNEIVTNYFNGEYRTQIAF